MDHVDEKIIELMNRMEEEEERNAERGEGETVSLTVGEETVEFEEKKVLEDKIKILVPLKFEEMSKEIAAIKYPYERRPKLIFTNESTSINIAFNHTKNVISDEQIGEFKDVMMQGMKRLQPAAKWVEDGVKSVNGKNVGFYDFITPSLDVNIYNFMFFTELNGTVFICTFNCTEEEMEDWRPIAREIMNSLKICE